MEVGNPGKIPYFIGGLDQVQQFNSTVLNRLPILALRPEWKSSLRPLLRNVAIGTMHQAECNLPGCVTK